jgi:hypothetical protein
MVLIYSHIISPRLQYICSFIFKELMGNDFAVTTDAIEFEKYDGAKINYSNDEIPNSKFKISNSGLLFETNVKEQSIECFAVNGYKAFFKTDNSDFPFDIFAASFYLLSRYEEYLPHEKDMYGRYAHENSLAFKERFLDLPLINIWIKDFAFKLKEKFSICNFQFSAFNFIPTYDIDIAYSYKYKQLKRNIGGAVKSLFTGGFTRFMERNAVLLGTKKDPFDTFEWLDNLHQQNDLKPIYFFLVAEKNYLYDKNILPSTKAMQDLIQCHAQKYSIGIHPSWQSGDDIDLLKNEINYLKNISGKEVTQSRQHYIRFNLPDGYRRLIRVGIKDDYSMGYGSINGFRASVASSFYWYDLKMDERTTLRIHPFCFMEANSFYEQHFSADETYNEMMHYYNVCKEVNGTFISLWHNHILGSDKLYEGWAEVYCNFLKAIAQ